MKNKYLSRITSSARGEAFNMLTWPFLFTTFAFGLGFVLLAVFGIGGQSVLYEVMASFGWFVPILWGTLSVLNIIGGITFLLFNIPPFGKITGLIGFAIWTFAGFCYALSGHWIVLFAVAIPNMFFWIWQYLSLTKFRKQDAADSRTMRLYNAGLYDDEDHRGAARVDRQDNRGVDRQ